MKSSTPLQRKTGLKTNVRLKSKFGLFKFEEKGFRQIATIKMHKNPPTPQKQLDALISEIVRRNAANQSGIAVCVTCGYRTHWKNLQCGHFQPRQHIATRYDLQNLGAQCESCNCYKGGENEKFAAYINATYGCGTAQTLKERAKEIVHSFPYEQEIEKCKIVLKKLVEEQDSVIKF